MYPAIASCAIKLCRGSDIGTGSSLGVADHLPPRARRSQEGLDAVHVVGVEVSEDDPDYRLVGDLPELLQHLPGGLGPLHRVDDDDAVLSLDHDAVGQTEIDRNVNIVQNFHNLLFIIFWFL